MPIAFTAHPDPQLRVIVRATVQLATSRCLRALQSALAGVAAEVVLIDDSPHGALAEIPTGIDLRATMRVGVRGLRATLMTTIAESTAALVCLVDDSAELSTTCLGELMKVMHERPRCGAVGAQLRSPAGRLHQAGGVVWNDGSRCSYGAGDVDAPEYAFLREVDYCSAAVLMLRKEALVESPVFVDDAQQIDFADIDLAFALRQRDWQVLYCPTAQAVQHGTGPQQGNLSAGAHAALLGQQQFRSRWQATLDRHHFAPCQSMFRARERTPGRGVMLVIDHYLPQPERDAGSRAIYQTMREFQNLGFLVKFWPANQQYEGAASALLENAGIEVVAGARWAGRLERYLRYAGRGIDTVVLSRPEVAADAIDLVKAHSAARLLYYGHDMHHRRMALRAQVTQDPDERAASDAMREQELSIWQRVDAVIYPSQQEAAIAAAAVGGDKVHVVPLYRFSEDELTAARDPSEAVRLLFVAGFGHSPNVDAADWLVRQILPVVRARFPAATLDLVGSNPTDSVRALGSLPGVTVSGSVSADVLHAYYRNASVAVVPLRFGAGVKLKVLEAMARGVPLVTTPVGAQGLDGVEAFIDVAEDAEDVAAAIIRAVTRPGTDLAAARGYVRQHYSGDGMRTALTRTLGDGRAETARRPRQVRKAS